MSRSIISLLVFLTFVSCASAQYGVNWPKQPDSPMATGVLPGPQILRVSGVNDFLYTYEVNVVEINTPVSVNLPAGAGGACAVVDVTTLTTDFNSAYAGYKKLFPVTAAPPQSLQDTQKIWKDNAAESFGRLDDDIAAANRAVSVLPADAPGQPPVKDTCQKVVDSAAKTYHDVLQPVKTMLFGGTHTVDTQFEAKACKTAILTVTEKYNGTPTGQSIVVRLEADCDQVTASGGILLTEIQNRTYTSAPLPGQTGQFLAVGGTGKFRPAFIALTNFNFPFEPLGHTANARLGDMRLGLSLGPVIQSSKSDVSSFGWFFGGTVSFLHRLYVSPGIHVGEFADFPLGFSPNQQIPSDFGPLTPVKRWTARFSISLTIKGWDISKTVKGGTDTPPTTPKN